MNKIFFSLLIFFSVSLHAQDKLPNVLVKTTDGKNVNLSNLIEPGKVTIISFWATWCKPCLEELDAIADEYDNWKQQVEFIFIAISVDDSRSSSRVKSFVAGKGWPFIFYLDPNQDLKRAMNISEIPFIIILDKEGNIVFRHVSYIQGFEQALFDELQKISLK